jgi:hypothetical protein
MTYELLAGAIRCQLCGSVSYAPGDIAHRYCGHCHLFHDAVQAGRAMHHEGTSHECGEWRTGRGVCAICEQRVPAEETTP